jgi:hypothetical protein
MSWTMNETSDVSNEGGQPGHQSVDSRTTAVRFEDAWMFVYVFFTNGTPFDAPNRSEPCHHS